MAQNDRNWTIKYSSGVVFLLFAFLLSSTISTVHSEGRPKSQHLINEWSEWIKNEEWFEWRLRRTRPVSGGCFRDHNNQPVSQPTSRATNGGGVVVLLLVTIFFARNKNRISFVQHSVLVCNDASVELETSSHHGFLCVFCVSSQRSVTREQYHWNSGVQCSLSTKSLCNCNADIIRICKFDSNGKY